MKTLQVLLALAVGFGLLAGSGFAADESWKSLNDKVIALYNQGKTKEALPLAEKAMTMAEAGYKEDSPEMGLSLNNLALLYKTEKKYDLAAKLYERSAAIAEKIGGPGNQRLVVALNNLALTYEAEGKAAEADKVYERLRKNGYKDEADAMQKRASDLRTTKK